MGFSGISIWQLLIILVIVLAIFGTKRLKNIGSDLGGAFKGFKDAMNDDEPKTAKKEEPQKLEKSTDDVIEGEAHREHEKHS